jgi:hypothetical protein
LRRPCKNFSRDGLNPTGVRFQDKRIEPDDLAPERRDPQSGKDLIMRKLFTTSLVACTLVAMPAHAQLLGGGGGLVVALVAPLAA